MEEGIRDAVVTLKLEARDIFRALFYCLPGQRSSITSDPEMEGELHSRGNRRGGPRVRVLKQD